MSLPPAKVEVVLDDGRTGTINPSWMVDAADIVEWRWGRFLGARDPVEQASALLDLQDAISDLRSFLPGFNMETGEVERPGDEE